MIAIDLEKAKNTIALLLRKAEDPAVSPEERETFLNAAQKKMLRLGIDIAELEAVGDVKPEDIIEAQLVWRGSYSIAMIPFTDAVAHGFGHLTTLQANYSDMLRVSYVIGTKSDVETFRVLITSLHTQAMIGLKEYQKAHRERRRYFTDMEKYTENRSFLLGFAQQVSRRLRQMRSTEEQTASTGAALVLASKESRVQAFVTNEYPSLPKARGGMQTDSYGARAAGRQAGQDANLATRSIAGKRGITS